MHKLLNPQPIFSNPVDLQLTHYQSNSPNFYWISKLSAQDNAEKKNSIKLGRFD